ncbi:PREDICTED: pinopsin-like [Gekko japonicus]|uniref:Pinopsin-like n=1 Tax=Gekko japonicus TaxID=146911 RepID=A0ABM1L0N6_GEKJA|nr:PREDICTED: pinopsin-like [Gekko japonicus]
MHPALGNQSLNQSARGSGGNLSVEGPLQASAEDRLGRKGLVAVAVCLGVILLLGCLNNLLVVLIFARFRAVRTPINLILLNISLSDLLVCVFGTPLSFAASVHGRWLLGRAACQWYGFVNAFLGIVSLVSLSILSYERYVIVLQRHTKANVSSYQKSWLCIATSWLYSLIWTLPPFFGWSSYGPEGPGISCSITWHLRTPSNISYVICLFVFCLLVPLLTMMYCYGRILQAIRLQVSRFHQTSIQKREHHILFMVVAMVTCYFLCWMPYGIVSLIATFGKPGMISPAVSIIPSILAKASLCVNPILYVLLNKQFYECFTILVKCGPPPQHMKTTFEVKSEPGFSNSQQSRRNPLASNSGQ